MILFGVVSEVNASMSTNDSTIWLKAFKRIVIDISAACALSSAARAAQEFQCEVELLNLIGK